MSVRYAQLHHVNIFTTQLEAMKSWYAQVLGMRDVFVAPFGAWVTNDRANHRIALTALPRLEPDAEKRVHARVHHVAFEYESFDDLNASFVRLRDAGILPRACLDHGMTFSYYYADPDENYVELQCDVFGNWDASRTWMESSPEFAANPIGAFVDPEKVAAAVADGTTFDEIRRRVWETDDFRPDELPDMGGPLPHPDDPPLPVKW